MPGKIHHYIADDHRRLDALLERATTDAETIEPSAYAQFRAGLLKHIGMEEKVLLSGAQKLRGGEPLAVAPRLRLDHGALAALLVPPRAGRWRERATTWKCDFVSVRTLPWSDP